VVELTVSGTALGFADDVSYAEQVLRISGGDILVLYTDGLVEIGCAEGCAPIELRSILERSEYGPDYHRALLKTALAEAGASDFSDDVTIVTARMLQE
jgi:serine phosphatase RsbU (regulator of sigma subunit)